ncbi:MAG: hypothetical protein AB1597_03340 [Chloroflexota bacterium]
MRKALLFMSGVYYFLACSYRMWRVPHVDEDPVVYTTTKNVELSVYPGKKKQSEYDFIVKYREPGKRERTPKHVHLIVELYVKYAHDPALTLKLRDHILNMLGQLKPTQSFPPNLQVFKPDHVMPFTELDKVGEFTVEFLLAAIELVAIQEATNYPEGTATEQLYGSFGKKDRFTVIQAATWTNKR